VRKHGSLQRRMWGCVSWVEMVNIAQACIPRVCWGGGMALHEADDEFAYEAGGSIQGA
jgi:hypothetical protein